mmetsp:Transcript_85493/g.138621  ORF Transcript_85493/g.138621 Transcript_85493/m.138621 type:complete len:94 (-) Transcript_85493:147-428(-)
MSGADEVSSADRAGDALSDDGDAFEDNVAGEFAGDLWDLVTGELAGDGRGDLMGVLMGDLRESTVCMCGERGGCGVSPVSSARTTKRAECDGA